MFHETDLLWAVTWREDRGLNLVLSSLNKHLGYTPWLCTFTLLEGSLHHQKLWSDSNKVLCHTLLWGVGGVCTKLIVFVHTIHSMSHSVPRWYKPYKQTKKTYNARKKLHRTHMLCTCGKKIYFSRAYSPSPHTDYSGKLHAHCVHCRLEWHDPGYGKPYAHPYWVHIFTSIVSGVASTQTAKII